MDLFPEGQGKMEGGKTRATLEDNLLVTAQNLQLVWSISLQQNQRCAVSFMTIEVLTPLE